MRRFVLSGNFISKTVISDIKRKLEKISRLDIDQQNDVTLLADDPPKKFHVRRSLSRPMRIKSEVISSALASVNFNTIKRKVTSQRQRSRSHPEGCDFSITEEKKMKDIVQLLKIYQNISRLEVRNRKKELELNDIQLKLSISNEESSQLLNQKLSIKSKRLKAAEEQSSNISEELSETKTELLELQTALSSAFATIQNLQHQLLQLKKSK